MLPLCGIVASQHPHPIATPAHTPQEVGSEAKSVDLGVLVTILFFVGSLQLGSQLFFIVSR